MAFRLGQKQNVHRTCKYQLYAITARLRVSYLSLKEVADTLPFGSLALVPVFLHPAPLGLHRFRQLFVQLPVGFDHIVFSSAAGGAAVASAKRASM